MSFHETRTQLNPETCLDHVSDNISDECNGILDPITALKDTFTEATSMNKKLKLALQCKTKELLDSKAKDHSDFQIPRTRSDAIQTRVARVSKNLKNSRLEVERLKQRNKELNARLKHTN